MRRLPTSPKDLYPDGCHCSVPGLPVMHNRMAVLKKKVKPVLAGYYLLLLSGLLSLTCVAQVSYHSGGPNAATQWAIVDAMILSGSGPGKPPLKISLEQVRNGSASSFVSPGAWANGNLNGSQAHFAEKWSIPYRLTFTGLPAGHHIVIIEWDIRANGKNALDYLTHYELLDNAPGSHFNTFGHNPESIDPTIGFSPLTETDSLMKAIPPPGSVNSPKPGQPTSNFNSLDASKRAVTIYNGSISAIGYDGEGSLTAAASSSRLKIEFDNTNSTVILAWGGHIAAEEYWGAGGSASAISGSPYHMRLISVDGSGGNQDRSLSADAVIDPPPCSLGGPDQVQCNTQNSYTNTISDLTGYTFGWSLVNNTSGASFNGSTSSSGSVSVNSGSAYGNGTCSKSYTVRFTVFKNGAEVSHCDKTTTVVDTQAPALTGTLPTGATNQNLCYNAIPAGPTAAQIAALYTDNCSTVNVTKSGTPTGTNCSWSVTYHYVIKDDCNNEATAVDITYSGGDKTAPTLTGNLPTGATNQNLCFNAIPAGPTASEIAALYTDNCGGTINVTKSGTPTGDNCSWSVTYHYVIKDGCNNEATAVDITYSGGDKTAPALTGNLPTGATNQNLCFNAIPAGPTAAEIAALYADNCGGTINVTKSGTPTGDNCSWSVTYHYVIKDACNNEATAVDITYSGGDKTAPALTGNLPTGATNQNLCFNAIPAGPTAAEIAALYADNCGGTINVTKSGTPTGDNCSWTVTYHYVIKDRCNNEATAVDITYSGGDKTAPALTGNLPTGATNQNLCFNAIPAGPTAAEIAALYTDNCGGTINVTKSGTPTGDNCSWTVTYHYVIKDGCNNEATAVDITYSGGDKTAPTLTGNLPTGATNQNLCFNAIPAGPTASEIAALYTDNCGGTINVTKSGTPTGDNCSWTVTYHYVIKDGCNNEATAVDITYSGGDTEDPVITSCPADITVDCSVGSSDPVHTGSATATDNCGTVTPTYNDVVSTIGCSKVITRTWTARDGCGHAVTCVQHINVIDRVAPVFNCTESGTPTVTDNCTATGSIVVYYSDNGSTRIWTAIDESGNIGTCTQDLSTAGLLANTSNSIIDNKVVVMKEKPGSSSAADEAAITVQAYPNPFKDRISFTVKSAVSGKGSLEVYNALGQKIRTVYQGSITKGLQQFELKIAERQQANLIYILKVGGEQVSGKILQLNR